jgi:hypothetical protein
MNAWDVGTLAGVIFSTDYKETSLEAGAVLPMQQ